MSREKEKIHYVRGTHEVTEPVKVSKTVNVINTMVEGLNT